MRAMAEVVNGSEGSAALKMKMRLLVWALWLLGLVSSKWVDGFEDLNVTEQHYYDQSYGVSYASKPLLVGLTLINGAAAKGAGIPSSCLSFVYYYSISIESLLLFLCSIACNCF